MAASQARYLALVARKTNCEYEGQQINQARLNLANKTASLFNQMLGLNVPVPPSVQDFTKIQYSFTDGINGSVIDKWEQLSRPDDQGNNYIVEYHYNANVYTGFQKRMNDPQIQFNISVPTSVDARTEKENITEIYDQQKVVAKAQKEYDDYEAELLATKTMAKKLAAYRDMDTTATNKDGAGGTNTNTNVISGAHYDAGSKSYIVKDSKATPDSHTFTLYDSTNNDQKAIVDEWKADGLDFKEDELYFCTDASGAFKGTFAFRSDLENLKSDGTNTGTSGYMSTLPLYHAGEKNVDDATSYASVYGMAKKISDQTTDVQSALNKLTSEKTKLEVLNIPNHVGNSELESLYELSEEEFAEIKQIIMDMNATGTECNFTRCFRSGLNISAKDYSGGIYKFERDGITYYTTYYDLAETAYESEFMNDIDNQPKLKYYHASYIEQEVNKTDRAILDTDSKGRFKTIRFAEDGAQYTLNFEEKTDDEAYQDAMNKFYYENAKYDKMIQDINAKTSIIQQEDRTLELRLKQLDTEQSALSNEIEAVQKVVKDGVEKGFKTFGG